MVEDPSKCLIMVSFTAIRAGLWASESWFQDWAAMVEPMEASERGDDDEDPSLRVRYRVSQVSEK